MEKSMSIIKYTYLEYTSSIWRSPCIKEVILASADKPLAAVGKLEGQHTAFMQVKLVLVGFGVV